MSWQLIPVEVRHERLPGPSPPHAGKSAPELRQCRDRRPAGGGHQPLRGGSRPSKGDQGQQSYFLWGPPAFRGDVLVVTQDDRASLERVCASVEEAGRHDHPWGMAEENGPIWVCRGLKTPLAELWPKLKKWN